MITKEEVLMGRDKDHPLTEELQANLDLLLIALNKLRTAYGKPMVVTSGYRPAAFNSAAGGAKKSAHMSCQAADFRDSSGELKKWCVDNIHLLEEFGLYLEHPDHTPTWCHLQIRPTKNRIFKP